VIKTQTHFCAAGAHQTEREDPICHQEAWRMVRGYLARGGSEAQSCQKGTVMVSLCFFVFFLSCILGTHDILDCEIFVRSEIVSYPIILCGFRERNEIIVCRSHRQYWNLTSPFFQYSSIWYGKKLWENGVCSDCASVPVPVP
jgi:hypothetical protein